MKTQFSLLAIGPFPRPCSHHYPPSPHPPSSLTYLIWNSKILDGATSNKALWHPPELVAILCREEVGLLWQLIHATAIPTRRLPRKSWHSATQKCILYLVMCSPWPPHTWAILYTFTCTCTCVHTCTSGRVALLCLVSTTDSTCMQLYTRMNHCTTQYMIK